MSVRTAMGFQRPAIFLVNGVGDQLIALPAIRALGKIFPHGIQLLLGEGMLSFYYRGLPMDEPVRVWWLNCDRRTIDVDRILARADSCDLFLCLSTWVTPSVTDLASRMGAIWSVGYFNVFDEYVPVDESVHMFDRLFSIPQRFSAELRLEDYAQAPSFSSAAEEAARRFVLEHVIPGGRILFIHPETRPNKRWNTESFSWVVRHFLGACPEFVAFVSSVEPFPLELGRHRHRMICVDHHLELAFAMMKHADLFLGVDSCFLHAADLLRLPGVGLFGPTDAHQWGFRFSPKAKSVCGKGSMEQIYREPVLQALLEIADLCRRDPTHSRVEVAARR